MVRPIGSSLDLPPDPTCLQVCHITVTNASFSCTAVKTLVKWSWFNRLISKCLRDEDILLVYRDDHSTHILLRTKCTSCVLCSYFIPILQPDPGDEAISIFTYQYCKQSIIRDGEGTRLPKQTSCYSLPNSRFCRPCQHGLLGCLCTEYTT